MNIIGYNSHTAKSMNDDCDNTEKRNKTFLKFLKTKTT